MVSNKIANEQLRENYIEVLMRYFHEHDYEQDVLRIKSNEIALPVIDVNGYEKWVVLTVKVPTGADKGREPFDGYVEAEDYEHKLKEKELKAKKKAEEKAKKIEHDKKVRGE